MTIPQSQDERALGTLGRRALCGWSPPSLAADTAFKRWVDVIRIGSVAAAGIVIVVVGLLDLAAHLTIRPALVVDALAGFLAGGWCSLNFWRCRHAHCLITGPTWLAFGVFALIEAAMGRSLVGGYEPPAFLGVLGAGLAFEALWSITNGTNALGRQLRDGSRP